MNKHLSSKEDCVYNTMNMNRMWNENDGSVGENVIYLVAMSMLFLIYFLGFYMYIPDLAVKLLSSSVPNATLVFFSLCCPHFVNLMPHRSSGRKGGHK